MTISSIIKAFIILKCYNNVGDSMDIQKVIIDFEENKIPILLDELSKINCFDLIKLIKTYNKTILINKEKLIVNQSFDFKVHLDVLFNYVLNYTKDKISTNDNVFIDIVKDDFILYWNMFIAPKLF